MLKIEKFQAGKQVQTILLPEFLVGLAGLLLPKAVQTRLAAQGLSIAAIKEAQNMGRPYRATFAVREQGVERQIVVSTS
jgi:hypothetical protein